MKSELARSSTRQPVRISLAAVADTTFLGGLRGELALQQTVALTAEGTAMGEALAIVDKDHPDVLILGANFLQMLPAVRLHSPNTKVILLAEQCRANILADALRLGARGCMSPRAPPREWLRAVRAVHAGEMWVGRRVLASVFDDLFMRVEGSGQPPAEPWGALSGRESQVANGVRLGLTNKEIARSLHISDATVKTHIESIFHKLNITRRVQLATLTSERGMRPDENITGAPSEG